MNNINLIIKDIRENILAILSSDTDFAPYDIVEDDNINECAKLSFKISPYNDKYKYLINENLIEFQGENYIINRVSLTDDTKTSYTVESEHETTSLKGVMNGKIDIKAGSPQDLIGEVLKGTNFIYGGTDIGDSTKRHLMSDEQSVFANLCAIAEVFNARLDFATKTVNGRVVKSVSLYYKDIDNGRYVRKGRNLRSVNLSYDTTNMITRLHVFGDADKVTGNEITMISVNPTGNPYIENYDYFLNQGLTMAEIQGNERFVKDLTIRNNELITPQMVYDFAVEELKKTCIPRVDCTVSILDLHCFEEYMESPIKKGEKLYVFDEDIDLSLEATIVGVSKNHSERTQTSVTISNVIDHSSSLKNLISSGKIIDKITDSTGQILGMYIKEATIGTAHIGHAVIDTFHLKKGIIDSVHIKEASIETAHIGKGVITEAHIGDAQIGNAHINKFSADKLDAGTINSSKVSINGTGSAIHMTGNQLMINDTKDLLKPKNRVILGEYKKNDTETDYGLLVRGEDGQTTMIDGYGVHNAGLTSDAVSDNVISKDANIDGSKLNIATTITAINEDTGAEKINGLKIEADGKSLTVALSEINMLTTENSENIQNNTAKIETNAHNISLKVSQNTYLEDKQEINNNILDINDSMEKSKQQINEIVSDDKFTPNEKYDIKREVDYIKTEKIQINLQANVYPIITTSKTNYNNAYASLMSYIEPLISASIINETSEIDADTFRNTFNKYYDTKNILLTEIQKIVKDNTTQVELEARKAQKQADNARKEFEELTNVNKLIPSEKIKLKEDWDIIKKDYTNNLSLANLYKVGTEKTNYTNAYNKLNTTIPDMISNMNIISDIDGLSLSENIVSFFDTQAILLKRISELAKGISDNALNIATNSLKDAKDYADKQIGEVNTSLDNLNNTMNGAFKDGIIDQAESIAIRENIKKLDTEKMDIDKSYTNLYANTFLLGTPKTNLKLKYDIYILKHTDLKRYIEQVISDDLASEEEKTNINTKMNIYNVALAEYKVSQNEALDNIALNKAKNEVSEMKTVIDGEVQDMVDGVFDLDNVLANAFKDGIIGESEAITIAERITQLDKEKVDVDTQYDSLYLNTNLTGISKTNLKLAKDDFNLKHTNIKKAINDAIADGKVNANDKGIIGIAMTSYNLSLARFSQIINEALDNIAENKVNIVKNRVDDIVSDGKFTPNEKQVTDRDWKEIQKEYPQNITIATSLNIVAEKNEYTSMYNTLSGYITPLLSNLATTSDIIANTFKSNFVNYYDKRVILLNKVSSATKGLADNAQDSADKAEKESNEALGHINDMGKDSKLTPVEKLSLDVKGQEILKEKTSIINQANTYLVSTSDYINKFNQLNTYLYDSGGLLINKTITSDINRTTFNSNFNNYYSSRQIVLDGVALASKKASDKAYSDATQYTDGKITIINNQFTSLGSEIDTVKNQISLKVWQDDINKTVSTIEIGGRNLTLNTNFETDLAGWSGFNGTTTLTKDIGRLAGFNSIKGVCGTNNGSGFTTPKSECVEDKIYTVSFWMKRSNDGKIGHLLKFNTSASGTEIYPIPEKYINAKANVWTYFTDIFTIPKGQKFVYSTPRVGEANSSKPFIWVTEFKLETGNKATDYTVAQEDVNGKINEVITTTDNKITTAKGEIKVTTDSISSLLTNVETRTTRTESNVSGVTSDLSTTKSQVAGMVTTMDNITQRVGTTETNVTTVTNSANTAKDTANKAIEDARLAKVQADKGINDAKIAKDRADKGVTDASNAQTHANTANNKLTDIASDSKLTANEKITTKKEWDIILGEKAKILAEGDKFGVSITDYTNKFNTLNTYITPLLSNLITTSDIVGATFRTNFTNYYNARQDILNAISSKAKSLADTAQTQANKGVNDALLASNKAGQSLIDAKNYTNTQITTVNTSISTANSEINQLKNKIELKVEASDISTAVSNIEIGGRNFATNTNKGVYGWNWSLQTGGRTISEVVENGIKCCKITRDAITSTGWSYISYNEIGRTKMVSNKQYTIAFDVKSSVVTDFWCGIKEGNSSNSIVVNEVKATVNRVNEWTRLSFTLTTKDPLPSSTSQVLFLGANSNPGVTYIFRNLVIGLGNKATDWTPAPEDTDKALDTHTTQISTTNSKVATIETSLTSITSRVSNAENTITTVNGKIVALDNRLKAAEVKITDSSIISTVQSTINTAKNEAINSANGNTTNQLKNYSTTSSMNSAITQSANSVKTEVSSNYVTTGTANNTYATKASMELTNNQLRLDFTSSGGTNRLRNSGFKTGDLTNWWIQNHNNANANHGILSSLDDWGFKDGDVKTLQINMSNQSEKEYGVAQKILTTVGKSYTISFYYAGHRLNSANLIIRSADGGWLSSEYFSPDSYIGGVGDWGFFTHTFTANEKVHTINIVATNAQENGYFWVAKPMVAEGGMPTPYTSHAEEIYSGNTIIDAGGVTINNGALKVKNNAGTEVISADSNGNLMITGYITGVDQQIKLVGDDCKIDGRNGRIRMQHNPYNYCSVGNGDFSLFNNNQHNNGIYGLTFTNVAEGHYIIGGSGTSIKLLRTSAELQCRNESDGAYGRMSATGFNVASKKEFKENIHNPVEVDFLKILKNSEIQGYNYKSEIEQCRGKSIKKDRYSDYVDLVADKKLGFILDDLTEEAIEVLHPFGTEGIDLYSMSSILWKVCQEQQLAIENLTKKVEQLQLA